MICHIHARFSYLYIYIYIPHHISIYIYNIYHTSNVQSRTGIIVEWSVEKMSEVTDWDGGGRRKQKQPTAHAWIMDAKHVHLHIYTAFYDAIYDNMTQTYDTVAVIAENVPQTHGHWLVHHNNDPTTRVAPSIKSWMGRTFAFCECCDRCVTTGSIIGNQRFN